MATIFDIAEKAQVSVITVSRLLNNPQIVSQRTAEKIFQVMDELNYQPSQIARSLVKKKTNTIGVIMPDIKNTFFNNWFRIVEDYASLQGFNLLLCNTDEDPTKEMKYVKLLQSQRVDGVIIAPCSKNSVDYLIKSNLHFILVDRKHEDINVDFVVTDHYQGSFDATEYLIKLGHRRIAVLRGSGVLYPDIERYKGFIDAMEKNSIEVDYKLVMNCEFDEMMGCKRTREILEREDRPTAIFSFNSLMMIGAINTIRSMKFSIPDDISLICFDQIPGYEVFRPKITCVVQQINSLAENSITALIDKINNGGETEQKTIFLKPNLEIGDSCRKIERN